MLLNRKYYQDLWGKYKNIITVTANLSDNFSILTFKIILEHCRSKKPLHINFQNSENTLNELGKKLFVELSNEIFCNAADFPQLNIGDKVRSKTAIRVGEPKPRFLDFKIIAIQNNKYALQNEKFSFTWEKPFAELVEKFIPVTQKAQNETLTRFTSFFEKLNGKQVHDFTPTYFDRKSVFIAPKTFYDSLEVKNKIPTTYFPNPREESNPHETKSIPALPDSIMYFVSKYKVCYDKILLQRKKVDTMVVFDTDETEIEQIIQDKNRFGFNLIIITNKADPLKYSQIPCWNWYKEETEIVNTLC
jgi:hypothetical protein